MALKDWKKVKSKYFKFKKNRFYLSMHNYNEKWQIYVIDNDSDLLYDYVPLKNFKTKLQALKFAKQYMKTH